MISIDTLKTIDTYLANFKNKSASQAIIQKLFVFECKYNLDVLNLIQNESTVQDQLDILKLLSKTLTEKFIFNGDDKLDDSIFFPMGQIMLYNLNKILLPVIEEESVIEYSVLLTVYKKLMILKSLSELNYLNKNFSHINIGIRIKNLKNMFLVICKM